jgi:uncharacterized protein YdeI (YjbR/CyaY-like superfamily)
MGKKDPRIDAYIAKSADFAKPILKHLRALVHRGCPEVEEDLKWSSPHFLYKGMFCGMAAFKTHCVFGFWNRALELKVKKGAMGQFGCITALSDLPADGVILGYVRDAKRLADSGTRLGPVRRKKEPLPVPKELLAALKKRPGAAERFQAFSPSKQREYSEWIVEAKTDETRTKRLATAVQWIGEGKPRMWKYMKAKPAKAATARRA